MNRFASPGTLSLIIAILLTSVFAAPLGAQTTSIRLEGIVWDPTGEPLSDVTLTAVESSLLSPGVEPQDQTASAVGCLAPFEPIEDAQLLAAFNVILASLPSSVCD